VWQLSDFQSEKLETKTVKKYKNEKVVELYAVPLTAMTVDIKLNGSNRVSTTL